MLPGSMTSKMVSDRVDFHFEYSMKPQTYELEGKHYIGIGVSAKMIDAYGNEMTEHIQDITTELEVAQELIRSLNVCKVSPMCLQLFVENFLASHE